MEGTKIGYIYKLCSKDVNVKEIYIGSTQNITRRKYEHKKSCNNGNGQKYNYPVYVYIRENGGFQNWEMIVLETVEYNEKHELHTRERFHLEYLKSTLNTQIPTRTLDEYYRDNKEQIANKANQYREDNQEQIADMMKIYYRDNKEKLLEKAGQYRQDHKETISNKSKQLYKCECGSDITISNKSRHIKTDTHLAHISKE